MSDYQKQYAEALRRHIEAVQTFATDHMQMPWEHVATHDASKWSPAEFEPYARHFYGPKDRPAEMAAAWLHHIHHNPHHWNHWIFSGGWTPAGSGAENGVLPMPKRYAEEMVADWHGASYAYTGSWDIRKWLTENMPRITLHSETAALVRNILTSLECEDVVYNQRWAHEE